MTTSCGKLLCAPVVVGKRFSFAGRNLCALRKARRAPLHPIGEYALLSPHAPTAVCRERTALSKRLTRSRELSAQNALVWVRGFRVFRLFLARVRVRWFSFFPFTSSPTYCNAMIINMFDVKTFGFYLHPLPHAPALHRFAQKVCFQRDCFQKPGSTGQKQPTVKVKTKSLHPKQTLHQPIAHNG